MTLIILLCFGNFVNQLINFLINRIHFLWFILLWGFFVILWFSILILNIHFNDFFLFVGSIRRIMEWWEWGSVNWTSCWRFKYYLAMRCPMLWLFLLLGLLFCLMLGFLFCLFLNLLFHLTNIYIVPFLHFLLSMMQILIHFFCFCFFVSLMG
jgi:hypothetical protein